MKRFVSAILMLLLSFVVLTGCSSTNKKMTLDEYNSDSITIEDVNTGSGYEVEGTPFLGHFLYKHITIIQPTVFNGRHF